MFFFESVVDSNYTTFMEAYPGVPHEVLPIDLGSYPFVISLRAGMIKGSKLP